MRPGHQDLNVNFFIFRSCRPLDGRQTPIFENFPIQHIFLKFVFFNIKMKKTPLLGFLKRPENRRPNMMAQTQPLSSFPFFFPRLPHFSLPVSPFPSGLPVVPSQVAKTQTQGRISKTLPPHQATTMAAAGEASSKLLRFLYFVGAGGISFQQPRVLVSSLLVCLTP